MSLGWLRHSCTLRLGPPHGSVAEQGCTVQPGSWYILQAAPVSGSLGPLQGSLSAHCRPCLVSPPRGQLHNVPTPCFPPPRVPGALPHWGYLWAGEGAVAKGPRGVQGKQQAGTTAPTPLSRSGHPRAQRHSTLYHIYTCADTCTYTSQIIKVYLGQCLWLRSFC